MLDNMQIRQDIIRYCLKMTEVGLNHGTAGNVSHRVEGGMLITPSGMPYDIMQPADLVFITDAGEIENGKIPSTEWRFHYAILKNNPDSNVVMHNHALYATMVSITGIDYLPAIHYMIALGGKNIIPCSEYATYGSEELNQNINKVMQGCKACILKNHGMVVTESNFAKAFALAQELEYLCQIYMGVSAAGKFTVLPDEEIDVVIGKFSNYGLNVKHNKK